MFLPGMMKSRSIMSIKHIIFVPGRNPEPRTAQQSELLWKTLVEGVRRADSRVADELMGYKKQFHLVNWNYHYYHKYREVGHEIRWVEALLNTRGPTIQDIKEATSLNIRMCRFILNLVDHAPVLIRFLPEDVRKANEEIQRYFDNQDNVAFNIRKFIKHVIRPLLEKKEEVLLIGHSLGSFITYDALWELTHQERFQGKVDFLTIGSPLGSIYMQQHLLGMNRHGSKSYPGMIRHWINISSEGDLTCVNNRFQKSFREMWKLGLVESIEDYTQGIFNFFRTNEGLNTHRCYGYLVNPAVGNVIADWWKKH